MEVGLLAALIGASVLAAFRAIDAPRRGPVARLAGLLFATVLTRADAVVPAAIILAFAAWKAPREGRRRLVAAGTAALALALAGQTAFRLLYFGDILPNTYYLKLEGVPFGERAVVGLRVFVKTLTVHLWMTTLLFAVLVLRAGRDLLGDRALLLVLLFAGQCAYSIYVGGDFEETVEVANRYLAVVMPAVFVFVCVGLARTDWPLRRARAWLAGFAGAAAAASAGQRFGALTFGDAWSFEWSEYRIVGAITSLLALVLVGGLFVLRWSRRFKPAWGDRMARAAPVAFVAAAFVSLNGFALVDWALHRGHSVQTDEHLARLGLDIRRETPPETVIAVVWAGTPTYWSRRASADLLGKSDAAIARSRPRGPFKPGHNKWNYRHSVETYRPALILQTWRLTRADRDYLEGAGYRRMPNGLYVEERSIASLGTVVTNPSRAIMHPGETP
jgi:hypothetical protein